MLVLLLLLISRLNNRSGLRISHSKFFRSGIYRLAFSIIILNDAFFVYFLICPLNVNLELWTIQYDVGQPVHKRYPQRMRLQRRQYGILWIFFSYIGFPKLYYFLFFSVYPLTTMLNAQDKIQSFRLSYLKNFRSSFVLLMYFIIQVFHNKLH